MTDLERANQRAAAAEKETEKLQHMASDTRSATEQDKVKLSRANFDAVSCPIVLIMGSISEVKKAINFYTCRCRLIE